MKIIEFCLKVDEDSPFEAVVESEINAPTKILIIPYQEKENGIINSKFRVMFEHENLKRRNQPFRENIAPVFPDGKKYPETK